MLSCGPRRRGNRSQWVSPLSSPFFPFLPLSSPFFPFLPLSSPFFPLFSVFFWCSRGANGSMSEIPVNSNTPPFGEDYVDHRECTLEVLTLNEVSGAAVPVTLHTHPPGDPCPAHAPVDDGTRDRAMSKCADVVLCRKQGWPRGRRVESRTTHAAMNSKSQALCLFCENFSASSLSNTRRRNAPHATRCTLSRSGARTARDAHVSSATDRRPSRLTTTTATLRSRSLAPWAVPFPASTVACLRHIFSLLLIRRSVRSAIVASLVAPAHATNAGSVARWLLRKHPHPPCAEPDPAQCTVGGEWAPTSLRGVLR